MTEDFSSQTHKESKIHSRIVMYSLCLLLSICAYSWPNIWASFQERNPYLVDNNFVKTASADRFSFIIVIVRGNEKLTFEDNASPYSGSFLAIYERENGEHFNRISPVFPCRSTTTALFPPSHDDIESIKYAIERDGYYSYGFRSVPSGLFTLKPSVWRGGDTSFLISEWGTYSGKVYLDEEQTLVSLTMSEDGLLSEGNTRSHSYDLKSECYIHPSAVKSWDHRGSHGCITLLKTATGGVDQDYDKFISILESKKLTERFHELALLVEQNMHNEIITLDKADVLLPEQLTIKVDVRKGEPQIAVVRGIYE